MPVPQLRTHVPQLGMRVPQLGTHVQQLGMHVPQLGMHVPQLSIHVPQLPIGHLGTRKIFLMSSHFQFRIITPHLLFCLLRTVLKLKFLLGWFVTHLTSVMHFQSLDTRDKDPPGYKSAVSRQGACHFDVDPSAAQSQTSVNGNNTLKRRSSIRSGGQPTRQLRCRPPGGVGGGGSSAGSGPSQIQLLSIPQLDAIQRTLRILDVRLQHVQSNSKDDDRAKQDIDHIRKLMSENQNALSTVVTVLSSIQEEIRRLSITVHKNQPTFIQIQSTNTPLSKSVNFKSTELGSSRVLRGAD